MITRRVRRAVSDRGDAVLERFQDSAGPRVGPWQNLDEWGHFRNENHSGEGRSRADVRIPHAGFAVKRFRGLGDPLCLLACALYLMNRLWMRSHLGGAFLQGHFDDMLMVPAALPMVLWIHERVHWRPVGALPTFSEVVAHVGIWSFVCEVLGPHLNSRAVGDPLDVLCYVVGGVGSWLWWHLPKRFEFLRS